jgi:fucose 4-O-acetylase-like acetyltransferase
MLYVDNIRAGLITLVIVGHMAITYGAPLGEWYYHEGEAGTVFSILFTLLLGIGAAFLLGLFFMISGYFTPRPYDRKGPGPFVLDRMKRLGIPLLFYALVINPLVIYLAERHGGYEGSLWRYASANPSNLTNASVGPLWFVEALLVFSIVYALVQLLARKPAPPAGHPVAPVPGNRAIALFAVCLGLATFIVRLGAPVGWQWEPPHQELAHWPQYVGFFAVGIVAYRHNWFERFSSAQARLWRWVALALVPLLPALAIAAGALSGEMDTRAAGGFNWLSLAYSLWEGFMGVAMVITVLIWVRDRFNRQGRLLRAMSAASYAVYVLHPLLIVPLALALSGVRLDLGLKFVLVAPLAVVLCFLVGHFVRRLPLVRNVL